MNASPNAQIWAMADAFQDKAEGSRNNLKKRYKDRVNVPDDRVFSGFDAFQKAIDSGVDLVILATPPGFRPPHFEYAVKQGKHVFMEKPVATDAPGIRKVLAAAEEAKKKNLLVQVGLQRRHENQYKETVKRLQDGAIGEFSFSRVHWNSGGVWVRKRQEGQTEMEYQMRNWYYFNWLCGDHICEQHIHNLDVGNWVKGDMHPVSCNAMGGREVRDDKETGEIFDHFFVEYQYEDGSRMYSQCRHIKKCWNSVSEAVHGTNGTCDVNRSIIRPKDGDAWRFSGKRQGGHQQEWHNLFASLNAGERPNEAVYGAHATMTAILGRMAAYSGQIVTWDEALKGGHDLMPKTLAWDAAPGPKPGADGHYPSPKPGIYRPF
jgi:predicted dehydrogenase